MFLHFRKIKIESIKTNQNPPSNFLRKGFQDKLHGGAIMYHVNFIHWLRWRHERKKLTRQVHGWSQKGGFDPPDVYGPPTRAILSITKYNSEIERGAP